MNHSDSESHDSDDGIRYKTVSTRYKTEANLSSSGRSRSRSRSPQKKVILGPKLPPHLRKDTERTESSSVVPELQPHLSRNRTNENSSSFEPQLPSNIIAKEETAPSYIGPQLPLNLSKPESSIGPQLPPHLQKNEETEDSSSYGPQLPPHLVKTSEPIEEPSRIGPQIPSHLRQKLQDENPPLAEQEESEDEIYGPFPPSSSIMSKAQVALEERALQLKMDQLEPSKDGVPVREEWMLELPEVKASRFGLGPRQFRAKAGPDMSDRTSWTDTPDKKHKKKDEPIDLKKETEMKEIRKRDKEQESISKKLKKKNKESLLDIHQSKLMKEKKDEGPSERRPFSRDIDLQVNRFDEAQKKAILKKAALLDDRFSSGQSKFL